MMNLDDVMEAWRSQDGSTLFNVDQTLLHEALRLENEKREKQSRWGMWGGLALGVAPLLISSGLSVAIMAGPNNDVAIVWDYVVGLAGVTAASVVAWTLFALRRSQQARDQGLGDSLRDHLRRQIAHLDYETTGGRRLVLITAAAGLICAWAIPIAQRRIGDVPMPYSELYWSPLPFVLIFVIVYLGSRRQGHRLSRKRQLEAVLKDLDAQ
jgi:hypothetical protein